MKDVPGQRDCSEITARQSAGSEFLVRCGAPGDREILTLATKPVRSCTEGEG